MEFAVVLAYLMWMLVDYMAAKAVKNNNKGININPTLYAVGAFLFGGIFPLIFLGCKLLYWKHNEQ